MIRVSGSDLTRVLAKCFTANDDRPLESRRGATAISGSVNVLLRQTPSTAPLNGESTNSGTALECDLFLWPDDRSYTRAPLAELHTFGSPPLLEALLAALCSAGARLAERGEFTLRAFIAGRIDLTQAEAVLGVIDARGQDEFNTALTQLAGGLAQPLNQLREDLMQLLAELEAGLDFVDEDIEFISAAEVAARLANAKSLLTDVSIRLQGRETATRRKLVALVGPPNAGKSSLFNALVARISNEGRATDRPAATALVSPESGTTRDYLTATLRLGGINCELVDTAGIEAVSLDASFRQRSFAPNQEIASAAQAAANLQRDQADVRLCCVDALSGLEAFPTHDATSDIVVVTKADLAASSSNSRRKSSHAGKRIVVTSSRTGQGLDKLLELLRETLSSTTGSGHAAVVAATAERCRESVRLATEAIERAKLIVADQVGEELVAAEIHVALNELGNVVGVVYTDDLLDRIFSTFCIGK